MSFSGTSLVVQWLRSVPPTQGPWVRFLVRELRSHILPCAATTEPARSRAHAPQLEKPMHRNEEPTMKTQCSQKKKKNPSKLFFFKCLFQTYFSHSDFSIKCWKYPAFSMIIIIANTHSVYYMPSTILITFHVLTCLFNTTILWGKLTPLHRWRNWGRAKIRKLLKVI